MIKLSQLINEAEVFTATSKETGTTSVFKTKDARDAAIKSGTHEKRKGDKDGGVEEPGKKDTPKVNIFKKDKEEPKKEPKKDKSSSSNLDANQIGAELSKSIGIDGTANVNNNNDIEFTFDENDRETSLFIGRDGDTYKVSVENPYGDDFGDVEKFDNQSDAIEYAKKVAKKYSKELGAKEEPKKDEPKDGGRPKDSTGGRAGNPEVNKAVRKKAQSLGITPKKLGKEEYESRMSKAAVEALTDSNFHSEARKLIAVLEDKPEWANDPRKDPKMPDIMSPEYEEWQKTSVYSSELYDSAEGTDDIAHEASNQAGWDGVSALDAIAFDLKMNGSKKLAAKIQGIIDDEKNESTKLSRLVPESIINEGTRSQVGIIDRSGKIASAYVHYDGYPSNMKPGIKKHMKNEKDVLTLIKRGGARGIFNDKDIEYFDRKEQPSKGNLKDFRKYVDNVDRNGGAEFVYLYNMKDKKWYFADVYGDKELKKLY